MGDLGEVWNSVKDAATLFVNGQSVTMGQRAFACPKGVQPADLDWANGQQPDPPMQVSMVWSNWAKDNLGMSSGTSVRAGCIWTFGGTSHEHPGLYLHDAYLWGLVDYSSAGTDYTITGGFGDAVPAGNTAELSGWIKIDMKYCKMHWESMQFDIRIRGNGYGTVTQV
jgi:hypothetical protein